MSNWPLFRREEYLSIKITELHISDHQLSNPHPFSKVNLSAFHFPHPFPLSQLLFISCSSIDFHPNPYHIFWPINQLNFKYKTLNTFKPKIKKYQVLHHFDSIEMFPIESSQSESNPNIPSSPYAPISDTIIMHLPSSSQIMCDTSSRYELTILFSLFNWVS